MVKGKILKKILTIALAAAIFSSVVTTASAVENVMVIGATTESAQPQEKESAAADEKEDKPLSDVTSTTEQESEVTNEKEETSSVVDNTTEPESELPKEKNTDIRDDFFLEPKEILNESISKALAATPIATDIAINETTFPDSVFRQYVTDTWDKDGNGILSDTDINTVTSINIKGGYQGTKVTDLTGIEYFTALRDLNCDDNQLSNLDVSSNTALKNLKCYKNKLSTLDLSKNTTLTYLDCSNNKLSSLDISTNTALIWLSCANNKLSSLDISANTKLTALYCNSNYLSDLNVGTNTLLQSLRCDNNQLSSLDVSKNTALRDFVCYNNQLSSLDVSKNTALGDFVCYNNQLSSLDLSKNLALRSLSCALNQLNNLDVSNNTALELLYCYANKLNTLDVSNNPLLVNLDCCSNQLSNLDLSKNTALTRLNCNDNQLSNLDVSSNTALTFLMCQTNRLSTLDVSDNTALTTLNCKNNQLISLNAPSTLTSATVSPQKVNLVDANADGTYDLASLAPTIDSTKITSLNGANITGTTLTYIGVDQNVTYKYNANNNITLNVTLKIKVNQASNSWTTPLTIQNWKYGETANQPTAAAAYGTPTYKYSDEENGTYTDTIPNAVGTWYVKAIVAETSAYSGLESDSVAFTIDKGDAPSITEPTNLTATYDQTLADITLTGGWAWVDDSTAVTVNNRGYSARLTVDDENYDYTNVAGYNAAGHYVERTLPVTVTKAVAPLITEPANLTGTYEETLADVTLTGGWTWVDDSTAVTVINNGYIARLTVDDENYDYTNVAGYNAAGHYVERTLTITVAKAVAPAITEPTNLAGTQDQTLADIQLPDGWVWVDPTIKLTVDNNGYQARLEVDDINYDYTNVEGYVGVTTFSTLPTSHYVERILQVTVTKPSGPSVTDPADDITGQPGDNTGNDTTTGQGGGNANHNNMDGNGDKNMNNIKTGDNTTSVVGGLSVAAILSACTVWFVSKRKKKID